MASTPLVARRRARAGADRRSGCSSGRHRRQSCRAPPAATPVDRARAVAGRWSRRGLAAVGATTSRDLDARPGVAAARDVPRPRRPAARGARRGRGPRRRHHGPDAAADRERGRHLRQEQDLLPRRRRGGRPTSSCASPRRARPSSLLVSDRHDNIGMDRVARAVADAGGADGRVRRRRRHLDRRAPGRRSPSTRWTRRSTTDVRRRGTAVDRQPRPRRLRRRLPRTTSAGRCSTARWSTARPATRLLGVGDPRSSGLGSWRDETGLSFDEVGRPARRRGLRGRRGRRAGHHDPGPRRQPGRRGARARLRRPGRRRPPPRPDRPDRGDRRERRGRLQLHDRHHRRRGVRHRDRAASSAVRRGVTLLTYRDGARSGSSRSSSTRTAPSRSAPTSS